MKWVELDVHDAHAIIGNTHPAPWLSDFNKCMYFTDDSNAVVHYDVNMVWFSFEFLKWGMFWTSFNKL